MTALRQQMIAAMRQRGLAARTHQSYLGCSQGFGALLPSITRPIAG
jgi:hypothetical protein